MLNLSFIGNVPLPSGENFLYTENEIAVLPITADNNGYRIIHFISGASIFLSASGAYVIVAKGVWSEWHLK